MDVGQFDFVQPLSPLFWVLHCLAPDFRLYNRDYDELSLSVGMSLSVYWYATGVDSHGGIAGLFGCWLPTRKHMAGRNGLA
jgi:hypothetical protein